MTRTRTMSPTFASISNVLKMPSPVQPGAGIEESWFGLTASMRSISVDGRITCRKPPGRGFVVLIVFRVCRFWGSQMALQYLSLTDEVRPYMAEELDYDVRRNCVYMSGRLTVEGKRLWEGLLRRALAEHDDAWLAQQLRQKRLMKATETTVRGPRSVPHTAPVTLSEGEFNRFYMRGLCRFAIAENIESVVVYRARESSSRRPESELMIGNVHPSPAALKDLRESVGTTPSRLGMPQPNSGLSLRLP